MNSLLPSSSSSAWPSRVRYLVLGWLCAAAAVAYIQRNCVGVLESTIRDDLGLMEKHTGLFMSGFYWTYAIFQIPSGRMGDRWGARATLPLYAALWSAATGMMALAGIVGTFWIAHASGLAPASDSLAPVALIAWIWLLAAALLSGAGQAGIFPCAAVVLARWFPPTQRGTTSGWLTCSMQVGAVAAAALAGMALKFLDWKGVFLVFSLPGFVWALGFFVWFRDRPQDHPSVNDAELALIGEPVRTTDRSADAELESDAVPDTGTPADEAPVVREPMPWLELAASPAIWWICSQQFFRAAAYVFFTTWFPTALQQSRGVSPEVSGYLSSLVLAAVLVGSLSGGLVSDRLLALTGSRRRARAHMAVAALTATAVLIGLGWRVESLTLHVGLMCAAMFCAALTGPVNYATTIEMGGRHVATVFAVMNMSGNVGAALMPMAVPLLLGEPAAWHRIALLLAGLYMIAALAWLLLKPEGTVFDQSLANRGRP